MCAVTCVGTQFKMNFKAAIGPVPRRSSSAERLVPLVAEASSSTSSVSSCSIFLRRIPQANTSLTVGTGSTVDPSLLFSYRALFLASRTIAHLSLTPAFALPRLRASEIAFLFRVIVRHSVDARSLRIYGDVAQLSHATNEKTTRFISSEL